MTCQPRDEMTPDAMARELGWSYERSGKALSWEAFCEELGKRFDLAARRLQQDRERRAA